MKRLLALFALSLIGMATALAQEQTMSVSFIHPDEWQAYLDAFVSPEGRVIDTANGSISHSESQGYGLLLAVLAQDRAGFERIWTFTRTELMIRDDGLAAWRWEPDASPNVTDINNATDGDILIAYALALAADAWGGAENREQAQAIARTVGETLIVEAQGLRLILPGQHGFAGDDQPDSPVVNLSYWVFESFPVLDALAPQAGWMEIARDGLTLAARATRGGRLPADWLALGGGPIRPAANFDPEFGYNNIRVPLYLMRANAEPRLLARFTPAFGPDFAPARIDVESGERIEEMAEPGYRLIGAALACTLDGTPVPADLQRFQPTSYYSATLQLLALAHLRQYRNACLLAGEHS